MDKTPTLDNVIIRTDIQSGDLGAITSLHGKVYSQEYGYNQHFERYVAVSLNEFFENFDREKDCLWVAESDGQMVGSIVIMGRSGKVAQLRYFILLPDYRGLGLGKNLMHAAMDFCKVTGYKSVYLWTAEELHAAAGVYRQFGFEKTRQISSNAWGKEIIQNCYDAEITCA